MHGCCTIVNKHPPFPPHYVANANNNAVPLLIQKSLLNNPHFKLISMTKLGRSLDPDRNGYMYVGHWYVPRGIFFFANVGLK